jgi:hypothetical protein
VYLLVFTHILLGMLIVKGLTARRLYKSFGVKGLMYLMVNSVFTLTQLKSVRYIFGWNFWLVLASMVIPVAARSKAWVCGRSLAGIVGSNRSRGTEVCLLCVVR